MRAHLIIKPTQNFLAAIDERCLHAEPVENAGELNRNITAANDGDGGRQNVKMESLIGGDGVRASRNIRNEGRRPHSNQNAFSRYFAPVHQNSLRVHKLCAMRQNFNAAGFEVFYVNAVEPVNFGVFICQKRRPVKFGCADTPTKTGGFFEQFGIMAGIDKQFFWHATANNACAAHPKLLGHRHTRAIARAHARRAHAAATGSDDKQVIVKTHKSPNSVKLSVPASTAPVA